MGDNQPGNQFSPDDVFYPYKAVFGIAEIDLGSDFGVATSANLTVNPVNDDATGEPLIEIHGDPADEISTAPEPLSVEHIVGEASSLNADGANPATSTSMVMYSLARLTATA